MTDSLVSIDKKCIFRETFENEQQVRSQGGVPTNVMFSNGVATFNGSTSYILCNRLLSGVFSIRIKLKPTSYADYRYLLEARGSLVTGVGYIYLDITTGTIVKSSGTSYTNGVASTTVTINTNNEIIISGITLLTKEALAIGIKTNAYTFPFAGDLDLFEIYQGTLTADEVKNLYENKRYREVSSHGEQLGAEMINQSTWYTAGYWNLFDSPDFSQSGTTIVSSSDGSKNLIKNSFWTVGKRYKIDITVTRTVGALHIYDGVSLVGPLTFNSSGTYSLYYSPVSSTTLRIEGVSFCGSITALSIKEVVVNSTKEILSVSAQDGTIRNKYSGDVYGSNLIPYASAMFDTDGSAWWNIGSGTKAWNSNGYLSFTSNPSTISYLWKNPLTTNGKQYRCSFKVKSDNYTNPLLVYSTGGGTLTPSITSSWQFVSVVFTALGADFYIQCSSANSATIDIDDIVLQEVIPPVVVTSTEVVKDNDVWAMKFNSTSSKISAGSYDLLTGDISIITWINVKDYVFTYAANNILLHNGKLIFTPSHSSALLQLSRDNGNTYAQSATLTSSLKAKYSCVCITSTSIGITNIYVNGILSGTANQSAGTPIAGTGDITIGSLSTSDRYFDGKIGEFKIIQGILTSQEANEYYTQSKSKYGY